MASTPRPLWPGYDEFSEEQLLELLELLEAAANDPDDETVDDRVAGGLAVAIARHEEIKRDSDSERYRQRVHQRAVVIAEGWQPR
jgi:hypothetical protein